MDKHQLLAQLETLKTRYRKLAWSSLMALSAYEEYLLDQKTAQEVAKSMKELFNDIPDSIDDL